MNIIRVSTFSGLSLNFNLFCYKWVGAGDWGWEFGMVGLETLAYYMVACRATYHFMLFLFHGKTQCVKHLYSSIDIYRWIYSYLYYVVKCLAPHPKPSPYSMIKVFYGRPHIYISENCN